MARQLPPRLRRIAFVTALAAVSSASLLAVLVAGRLVAPAAAGALAPQRQCLAAAPDCAIEPVVRRFVATAVERRDPGASFALVTPELRQGMTRAEWATGNIPVVPFHGVDWTGFRLSFSDTAAGVRYYRLHLDGVDSGSTAEFWIGVSRSAGTWLVSYFAPFGAYGAPSA